MSFKTLELKKAYDSEHDDILYDFYIPVLSKAVKYSRLTGFFSSTSLAIAARGVLGLIKNGGKMRVVVSPKLSRDDLKVMLETSKDHEKYIEEIMEKELDQLEDKFVEDHLKALGWMLANDKLEIKVAIIYDDDGNIMNYEKIEEKGIFHQKIGILEDREDNIITFSGSVNETAMGWTENIEEFKVFKSWEDIQNEYIKPDVDKFQKYWHNESKKVKVIDVPSAVKNKLIRIAPKSIDDLNLEKVYKQKKCKKVVLYQYQKNAVTSWVNNNMKGIFEMATGTGKTYTALGCLDIVTKKHAKWLAVIACPQNHLIDQWQGDIKEFGIKFDGVIVADNTNSNWKKDLVNALADIYLGYRKNMLVMTTHRTLSNKAFINIIKQYKRETKMLLIADEVHGLGARKQQRGLLDEYEMRLGLSATPKRWYDDVGTEKLYEYFGDTVYEFDLQAAINTINPATGKTYLTPYRYIPKFVKLSEEELLEYIDKTAKILRRMNKSKSKEEKDEILEMLLFQRADLIKNVQQKFDALEEILDELGAGISSTIIYCSPGQIDIVMERLARRKIIAHKFTQEQGTNPEKKYGGISERKYLLDKFSEGKYQVLVALKCLDEGVNVTNAHIAILMASSANPREYIQRIGRVIRRHPGKEEATIYDLIVVPSFTLLPPEWKNIERRIFKKELIRAKEIAMIAKNNASIMKQLDEIEW
jgi:superfamily II DNA or RNA helicase